MLIYYLAQATPSAGGDSTLLTVVYVLTAVSFIAGFIIGTYKYIQSQKKKWTEEGTTRAKQAQVVEENSKELKQNTSAIVTLSERMESWMAKVDANMNGMSHRIEKLERFLPPRGRVEDMD